MKQAQAWIFQPVSRPLKGLALGKQLWQRPRRYTCSHGFFWSCFGPNCFDCKPGWRSWRTALFGRCPHNPPHPTVRSINHVCKFNECYSTPRPPETTHPIRSVGSTMCPTHVRTGRPSPCNTKPRKKTEKKVTWQVHPMCDKRCKSACFQESLAKNKSHLTRICK